MWASHSPLSATRSGGAKLAADPGAIGRQIVLGGRPHTIVGILPEQFVFALDRSDVWRPLQLPPPDPADPAARAGFRVLVVARLARNVSPKDLAAVLDDVSRRSSPPAQVVATGMATAIARGSTRTLGLLAGAAALAFLIAFANLAGLLLVRSIDRRRELAVRTALGARPSEIARQLVLEAETLVAIGIAGWCAARVVADTSRGPSCPGAIRRCGEPRGGGELARDWCRGDGRRGLRGTLWIATGLCRVTSAMLSTC